MLPNNRAISLSHWREGDIEDISKIVASTAVVMLKASEGIRIASQKIELYAKPSPDDKNKNFWVQYSKQFIEEGMESLMPEMVLIGDQGRARNPEDQLANFKNVLNQSAPEVKNKLGPAVVNCENDQNPPSARHLLGVLLGLQQNGGVYAILKIRPKQLVTIYNNANTEEEKSQLKTLVPEKVPLWLTRWNMKEEPDVTKLKEIFGEHTDYVFHEMSKDIEVPGIKGGTLYSEYRGTSVQLSNFQERWL